MTRQEWQTTGVVMAVLFAGYGAFAQPTPTVEETMRADGDVDRAVAQVREDVRASGVVPREYEEAEREAKRAYEEVQRMELAERKEKPEGQEAPSGGSEGLSGAPVSPEGGSGGCEPQEGSLPRGTLGRTYHRGSECLRVVIDGEQIAEQAEKHGMSEERARCVIEQHEQGHAEGVRGHSRGGVMDATPLDEEVAGC
jgi:hypothetical protein